MSLRCRVDRTNPGGTAAGFALRGRKTRRPCIACTARCRAHLEMCPAGTKGRLAGRRSSTCLGCTAIARRRCNKSPRCRANNPTRFRTPRARTESSTGRGSLLRSTSRTGNPSTQIGLRVVGRSRPRTVCASSLQADSLSREGTQHSPQGCSRRWWRYIGQLGMRLECWILTGSRWWLRTSPHIRAGSDARAWWSRRRSLENIAVGTFRASCPLRVRWPCTTNLARSRP